MEEIHYYLYNLHFPSEVRVSEFTEKSIRYKDNTVLLYDINCHTLILRHFIFYNKWFNIHCFLDRCGSLEILPGPIDCCFCCDISTPIFNLNNNFYSIDLAYDILVGPDGKTHIIKDEDEFLFALSNNWITEKEGKGAQKGLEEIKSIIAEQGLIIYLDSIFPFKGSVSQTISQKYYHIPLDNVNILQKEQRQNYIFKEK
jgi:hypothetical protein